MFFAFPRLVLRAFCPNSNYVEMVSVVLALAMSNKSHELTNSSKTVYSEKKSCDGFLYENFGAKKCFLTLRIFRVFKGSLI